MRTLIALAAASAAGGAVAAVVPIHGASAVISGVACRTIDLTPDDGIAPYARILGTKTDYGPFSVSGLLAGNEAKDRLPKARTGSNRSAIYLTLNSRGSSGVASITADGNGTAGLLSVTSVTAPGRPYDAYEFDSSDYVQFRLGPNSSVECTAEYAITAWAKQVAGAPAAAASTAAIYSYELATGEGGTSDTVKASADPLGGKGYEQKNGKLTVQLYNYGVVERSTSAAIRAYVTGGKIIP